MKGPVPVAAHSVRHPDEGTGIDPACRDKHCLSAALRFEEASGIRHQASGDEDTDSSIPLRSAQNDRIGTVSAVVGGALDAPGNSQFSTINGQLPSAWDELLAHPFDREPHRRTLAAAEAAAALETVYPRRADWFAALRLTPPERVRVVILGQDPYHEPGQAMGLAFSVRPGVKLPPSLRNIYRELEADLGVAAPKSGDLSAWARQGVLLLNTVLTVAAGRANSHKNLGWQALTREIIAAVSRLPQPVAFVLWGAPAQRAYAQGTGNREQGTGECAGPRLILTAPHPSPLSAYRGFFGSRPFSQINDFLTANGEAPIRWSEENP